MRWRWDRRRRQTQGGPLWWVMLPAMVVVVAAFAMQAVVAVMRDRNAVVVEFSVQPVERVDPATGVVSVPVVEGYDGPAVQRGRMVNRTFGTPDSQLRERHDASDFDLRTQDKLDAAAG